MTRFIRGAMACTVVCCLATPIVQAQTTLELERVATGLDRPVFATHAPGDPNTLYIAEQHTGQIRALDLTTNTLAATPVLDISGIDTGNEQGLLGLAFHPDFQNNGYFYTNTTNSSGDTEINRYTVTGGTASVSSKSPVLSIDQPFSNNNGGWMAFGPDNLLYIATGDGGSGGDPFNNAQDITNNLLGKILRIDVDDDDFASDANRNYAIPNSNPFVGVTGDDEIYAYGLRSPWRNSFDRETGDLYIADVGQGTREEINVIQASSVGGENFGWRVREGTTGSALAGAIDPVYDYEHGFGALEGFAVTGGYVYRGPVTALQGEYFFADYVTEHVWSFTYDRDDTDPDDDILTFTDWTNLISTDVGTLDNISSFAEDAEGNLYIIDLSGEIYKVVPEPSSLALLGLGGLAIFRRRRG